MTQDLELVIEDKVKPMLDTAMQKYLGVRVNEIKSDISDKIRKNPLMDFEIDVSMTLKQARNKFRRVYLIKLLQTHFGNISKVAEISGLDRRTVHRLVKKLKISSDKYRKDMMRTEYIKELAVKDIIEETLDNYKQVINPQRMGKMYRNAEQISKNITKELPEEELSLKDAEHEFEKKFIAKALKQNDGNVTKTAKQIGIRYETLHRKVKSLSL